MSELKNLLALYKQAAVTAKQAGDNQTAVAHLRTMKQLQPLLEAASAGQQVDMASLPPPPSGQSEWHVVKL